MGPLEETVMTTLKAESEIKFVTLNLIQELSGTAHGVRTKVVGEEYIMKMKEA